MRSFGPVSLADQTTTVDVWFSPNTSTNKKTDTSPMPGDLNDVYALMDHAEKAIFFLTFMPGESRQTEYHRRGCETCEGSPRLAGHRSNQRSFRDAELCAAAQGPDEQDVAQDSGAVGVVASGRAEPHRYGAGYRNQYADGDLHPELLSAGHAIIHDKIIVIDPLDREKCTVITGSHNLGHKASYDNDENLLIIRGNRSLAVSYAVHVIESINTT